MSENSAIVKPCPFCGGPAELIHPHNGSRPYILCSTNFCAGPQDTAEKAIATWNRRAALDPAAFEQEAMHLWAVFDPNWGEPVPLLTTIRATETEAITAALNTDERGASLYAMGGWDAMQHHGFKLGRIAAAIRKGDKGDTR